MGLFDIFGKKSSHNKANLIVTTESNIPKQTEQKAVEPTKNYLKNASGLYPYEILLLNYAEKYLSGKPIARFWQYDYGVEDVMKCLKSLEKRGFICDGKLTDLGNKEIKAGEYVLYMHRHKFSDIPLVRMCALVNKHPEHNYRDILWGEFNRLSLQYSCNRQYGWYRNTRYNMYMHLKEEKRYLDAFLMLAEVVLFDLNGSVSPLVPPAIISALPDLVIKIGLEPKEAVELLADRLMGIYTPHKNYPIEDVVSIIAAYSFGDSETAELLLNRDNP